MAVVRLVLVNQKGGVGKTTVALGLAEAAAAAGWRTLVVDLDPQANATAGLGVWDAATTIDDVLANGTCRGASSGCDWQLGSPATGQQEAAASKGQGDGEGSAQQSGGRIDVIAGDPKLAYREPQLASDPLGAQDCLRRALLGPDGIKGATDSSDVAVGVTAEAGEGKQGAYDVVLIDSPPSLGLLCVNGLFAAEGALVVTEPAAWAADGVDLMTNTIAQVKARQGEPELIGIVPNRVGRTRDHAYWNSQLAERFGNALLPSISLRAAVAEASGQSLPLRALRKRPGAPEAVAEFDALWQAVAERVGLAVEVPTDESHLEQMPPAEPGQAQPTERQPESMPIGVNGAPPNAPPAQAASGEGHAAADAPSHPVTQQPVASRSPSAGDGTVAPRAANG